MTNPTQPSQQVPVAMTVERIREIAGNHFQRSGNAVIASGENEGVHITTELLAFAKDLLAQSAPDAGLAEDALDGVFLSRLQLIEIDSRMRQAECFDKGKIDTKSIRDCIFPPDIDVALATQEPQHG